jgi:hypothetical protein
VSEIDRPTTVHEIARGRRFTAIAATEEVVALAAEDGRVRMVTRGGKGKFMVPLYRSGVRCCAISRRFGILVIAMDDRRLILVDAETGKAVRVIHLPVRPEMVEVTPGWGFVIVSGSEEVNGDERYSVLLYSINGDFIRNTTMEGNIDRWCAWASPAGFDFVLCGTEDGRIYGFEAFWLEIGGVLYNCGDRLVALEYAAAFGAAVAVTRGGKLHIVPFLTRSIEKYA